MQYTKITSMNPDANTWFTISGVTAVLGETVPAGDLAVDQFPDGSFSFRYVYNGEPIKTLVLTMKTTLPQAVVGLAQVIDLMREAHGEEQKIWLVIQTTPDQRADRATKPGESVAARAMAHGIVSCGANNITLYDVHSPMTRGYWQEACDAFGVELKVIDPLTCFNLALAEETQRLRTLRRAAPDHEHAFMADPQPPKSGDYIIAVDKGAVERAQQVADHYGCEVLRLDKERYVENGEHKIRTVLYEPERSLLTTNTTRFWIVDDLCDGGRTFIEAAKVLNQHYPIQSVFGGLILYCTHGIFSQGREKLRKHFAEIYSLFSYDC